MGDVGERIIKFPEVHHIGVAVKDINKVIRDVEVFGIGRSAYSRLPRWLENMLFKGKYFDTRYNILGTGPFIHPMMYTIIEVGSKYDEPHPDLPPLASEPLFRDKPFTGEYKIFKMWMGDKILELIEPGQGKSPWKEHIDNKGEGFQHIGFNVDDLEGTTSTLIKQGAERLLHMRLEDGTGGDYLHLGHGFILEIFKGYY